jgi:hypothetical protein
MRDASRIKLSNIFHPICIYLCFAVMVSATGKNSTAKDVPLSPYKINEMLGITARNREAILYGDICAFTQSLVIYRENL